MLLHPFQRILPMKDKEYVILVDKQDRALGTAEKLAAHQSGQLHRAFSVFIFYKVAETFELLLQQRHPNKYHSGGLWTNTCCSHPRPGESIIAAAERRLFEEMGMKVALKAVGSFVYSQPVSTQLTEHEFDHILIGIAQTRHYQLNTNEAINARWINLKNLSYELKHQPDRYTVWFQEAFNLALASL